MGVLTSSISTQWNQFNWNQADWAGISKTPEPIGEVLNAYERSLTLTLNGLAQAQFRISQTNPMATEITSRDAAVLLKVYQDATLRFVGECTSVEEVGEGDEQTLQANFADPSWRLGHRLCRKANDTGQLTAAQPFVSWSATPAGEVIRQLVDNANRELLDISPGIADTGIRMGTVDTIADVTVGTEPFWNYKPVAEALTEMQAANPTGFPGAFDFQFSPVEPVSDGTGLQITALDVRTRIGTDRPEVVFEYGDGNRAVRSYRLVRNRQNLLNRAYVLGADPTNDAETVKGFNGTSQQTHGLHEGLVPIDVGNPDLRQAWADINATVRGEAQWRFEFSPSGTGPRFGANPPSDGDYELGDTVRVRVKIAGTERIDATNLRVYGITLTIDDEGKETITPNLSPE